MTRIRLWLHSCLCVACLLCAAACGFRPLYAPTPTSDGRNLLDQVWINTIQASNGVILRNYLLDGFYRNGYPDTARYSLNIYLNEYSRDVDVQKNDTTTRAQYVAVAVYELRDRTTNRKIDSGQVRAVSGYNILLSQYTTLITQKDAKDRALREIAEKLQTRVALVLSSPETGLVQDVTLPPAAATAP